MEKYFTKGTSSFLCCDESKSLISSLLDCFEYNSTDHSDDEDAKQLPSDGMDDHLAKYMGGSLLDNSYDDLNEKIPKSIHKETGHTSLVECFPNTAQPLSEPRRHQILPSKHNDTNTQ